MTEFLGPSTRSLYLITYCQACTIKLAGREEFKKLVLKVFKYNRNAEITSVLQ